MTSPTDRLEELRRRAEQWLVEARGVWIFNRPAGIMSDLLTALTEQTERVACRERALDDWMLRVQVLEAELRGAPAPGGEGLNADET